MISHPCERDDSGLAAALAPRRPDDVVMSGWRALIKGYFGVALGRGCGHVFGTILRIVQVKEHFGARRDNLRISQPLVECLLVPRWLI